MGEPNRVEGYGDGGGDDFIDLNPPERRFRYFNRLGSLQVVDRPQDYLAEAQQRRQERVVVCIDGSNLFYAAASLHLEIDYSRLLKQAVAGRSLIRAYFYTGVDPSNDKQKGFLLWMRRHGYRVVTRELVALPDGSKSANLDVEIAVDMVQLAHYCDTIVLFSGDGDLAYAVERAAQQGVRLEVVSLRSMTSEALLNVADQYVDLQDLAPLIQRSSKSRSDEPTTRTPAFTVQPFPPEQGFALG